MTQLTESDARESLTAHVAAKGAEINQKYGPQINWEKIQILLEDRAHVRYPCQIQFDATSLRDYEFAYPDQIGEQPEDGFILFVHPCFAKDLEHLPHLILYQLVAVNYGDFAGPTDAEVFGAAAMGMDQETYYQEICRLADSVPKAL